MDESATHADPLARLHDSAGPTDGQLLETFIARREDAAFAALVRRHGPMVLAVCRRVLRHEQDAEDAFQATFLVLACKAESVVPRRQVGSYLHAVAYRTALKARSHNARRRDRERAWATLPRPEPAEEMWQELQALLDHEIGRLSEKYRAAVVLCDLEGKTIREAALLLGCPQGTVAGRLARARALLARGFARRRLTLSAGPLAASAAVPGALAAATARGACLFPVHKAAIPGILADAAVALTKEVLNSMLATKVKLVALAALALVVIGTGVGAYLQRTAAAPPVVPPADDTPRTRPREPADAGRAVAKAATPDERPDDKPAEKKDDIPENVVVGTMKTVLPDRKLIVLEDATTFKSKAFDVPAEAKVFIDGVAAPLGDLETADPNGRVHLRVILSDDKKNVVAVHARTEWQQWPSASTSVVSADAEKNTVKILTEVDALSSEGPAHISQKQTLDVAKGATVTVDDKAAKLADFKEGMRVKFLLYSTYRKAVMEIHVVSR
jgi:RNA polymerase sigma factor (sigma-70 family)